MNYNEIEQLVERFLNGKTTLTEERSLERFFRTHSTELPTMPEPMRIVAAMFDEFQREREKQTATLITRRPVRQWAVAASIAILFCLSAAAFYHLAPKTAPEVPTADTTAIELPADTIAKPDFFVFDNVEMQAIADTLSRFYGVEPVFQSEGTKRLRLYVKVEKGESIENVVELLNNFKKIDITLQDGKLIIK